MGIQCSKGSSMKSVVIQVRAEEFMKEWPLDWLAWFLTFEEQNMPLVAVWDKLQSLGKMQPNWTVDWRQLDTKALL